ncbi:hypothetical protein ACILDS_04075 [Capnocytophaga canis]|uniref:hypothetical protein n=1 Tax=Capnocytophaga canis TaxID=1848903 RepID=UPI0037D656C8
MNKIIIFFTILFIANIALAQQESNVSFVTTQKHQVGIGISKFVNMAFPSDANAFLFEYKYSPKEKLGYRLAGDYRIETTDDAIYDIGLKIGVETILKQSGNWSFYYGIDLWGRHIDYTSRKQRTKTLAINPFFGISYRISKHLSICTEPGFFIKYSVTKDNNTFDLKKTSEWFESRLAKIGYIQFNFHF